MQRDSSEPRQVRKEATVARQIVCRRVPSLSLCNREIGCIKKNGDYTDGELKGLTLEHILTKNGE